MSHDHHHHHQVALRSISAVFVFCLVINVLFVVGEALAGYWSNSLGLVSDAGHNLSDVLGLVLAMIAFYMMKRDTKGSKRYSRIISVVNALLLLVAVVVIVVEAIEKIINTEPIDSVTVIIVAAIAIVINGITAWLLAKENTEDVNIRAAYLHAFTDTLVSVGVVVSGVIIYFTGANIIDPIISLIISAIIFFPSLHLLIDSVKLLSDHGNESHEHEHHHN